MKKLSVALFVLPWLLADFCGAQGNSALGPFLQQTLRDARENNHLPGVAALVQIDGKVAAEAAVGVRALGDEARVLVYSEWDADPLRSQRFGLCKRQGAILGYPAGHGFRRDA